MPFFSLIDIMPVHIPHSLHNVQQASQASSQAATNKSTLDVLGNVRAPTTAAPAPAASSSLLSPILSVSPTVIGLASPNAQPLVAPIVDSDATDSQVTVNGELPTNLNTASCCPVLKLRYETCFQQWFSDKFLHQKGQQHRVDSNGNKQPLECDTQFQEYRRCVLAKINADPDMVEQLKEELRD